MTPEHSLKLKTDFAPLYDWLNWGFDCEDGWFDLLYDLSKKITEKAKEQGIEIRGESLNTITDEYISGFYVTQVKEKYGTLRFYTNASYDCFDALIDEAEDKTQKICEICGKEGKFYLVPYMYQVRCKEHEPGMDHG